MVKCIVTVLACAIFGGQFPLSAAMAGNQTATQGPPAQSTPPPSTPAQSTAAAPPQAVVTASFQTCADWKQTKPVGDAQLEAVWKVARLGFAHGISAGLQADPIGFSAALAEPPKSGGPDPLAALGDLGAKYAKGLDAVINRPAVLVEGFDDRCGNFRNESIKLIDLTTIITLEIGGVLPAVVEDALLKLRAGGAGAHAAMMAALRGK